MVWVHWWVRGRPPQRTLHYRGLARTHSHVRTRIDALGTGTTHVGYGAQTGHGPRHVPRVQPPHTPPLTGDGTTITLTLGYVGYGFGGTSPTREHDAGATRERGPDERAVLPAQRTQADSSLRGATRAPGLTYPTCLVFTRYMPKIIEAVHDQLPDARGQGMPSDWYRSIVADLDEIDPKWGRVKTFDSKGAANTLRYRLNHRFGPEYEFACRSRDGQTAVFGRKVPNAAAE